MNDFILELIRYTDDLSSTYGSGDATLDGIAVGMVLALSMLAFSASSAERSGKVANSQVEAGGDGLTSTAGAAAVGGASSTVVPLTSKGATLGSKLRKTNSSILGRLKEVLVGGRLDEGMLEELEYALLASDVGPIVTSNLLERLSGSLKESALAETELKECLVREIQTVFKGNKPEVFPDRGPRIIMIVGVNGAGKTTSVGKLAHKFSQEGKKVLLIAADTFRAAAMEQLQTWGSRSGVEVVTGPDGCKPSGVVFDGLMKAKQDNPDVILIDTAGRLHTKTNLMQELAGVRSTISKQYQDAPHETWLVLDGTSGQNGLVQAREFHQITPLSGVIVTKLDSSSKGGIVVAVVSELGVPIRYIGVGEGVGDLRPFDGDEFSQALFEDANSSADGISEHAQQRRQRRRQPSTDIEAISS